MEASVEIEQESVVGPTLGSESIKAGIISFIIAIILLMIYMCLAYEMCIRDSGSTVDLMLLHVGDKEFCQLDHTRYTGREIDLYGRQIYSLEEYL